MKTIKITELNELVNGELLGDTSLLITGTEQLERAKTGHISFIGSKKYIKLWQNSKAVAAIINDNLNFEPEEGRALIRVKNADLAMVKILEAFDPGQPQLDSGIHTTATVHESAQFGENCVIGARCYIGKDV